MTFLSIYVGEMECQDWQVPGSQVMINLAARMNVSKHKHHHVLLGWSLKKSFLIILIQCKLKLWNWLILQNMNQNWHGSLKVSWFFRFDLTIQKICHIVSHPNMLPKATHLSEFHIVWKSPKMSHLAFSIFVILKLTYLVALFDPKNSPKWTIFGIFH